MIKRSSIFYLGCIIVCSTHAMQDQNKTGEVFPGVTHEQLWDRLANAAYERAIIMENPRMPLKERDKKILEEVVLKNKKKNITEDK